MNKYYDWNHILCKELCCEMEKFDKDPTESQLCNVHKLVETLVGLQELEAAGAMRKYLEDEHGYDSRRGDFRNMEKFDNPYRGVFNATSYPNQSMRYPTTYPTPYYPGIENRGGERMNGGRGGDYNNRGGDGGGRYNDGRYNRGDEGYNNRGRDSRDRFTNEENGNGGYRNEGYGIYNHADPENMKKKLTEQEKQEWLDSMQNSDGTSGETFSKEECSSIAKKVGAKFDKYSESDFCIALNAVYSDYCDALTKADAKADDPKTYGYLALAWLEDEDSYPPEERLARYWHYMVKH